MRCLLGLLLFGTVLPGLLVEFLFGLYQFLVMLLGWLLLMFWLLRLVKLRLPDGMFIGLVILVQVGRKRIRLNRKNPSTPCGFECACSSTSVEEVALFWVHWVFQALIARGGDAISII